MNNDNDSKEEMISRELERMAVEYKLFLDEIDAKNEAIVNELFANAPIRNGYPEVSVKKMNDVIAKYGYRPAIPQVEK